MAGNPRQHGRRAGAVTLSTVLDYKREIKAITKKTVRFWVTLIYSSLFYPNESGSPGSKNLKTKFTSSSTREVALFISSQWLNRFPSPIFFRAKMLEIRHMSSLLPSRVRKYAARSTGLWRFWCLSKNLLALFTLGTWNSAQNWRQFTMFNRFPQSMKKDEKYCYVQRHYRLKSQKKSMICTAFQEERSPAIFELLSLYEVVSVMGIYRCLGQIVASDFLFSPSQSVVWWMSRDK